MKLDNTKYIVQDLITKGLVSEDNKDKVAEVIAAGGKTNKEYQTKKWILDYLEYYSCHLIEEADVDTVYFNIKNKYKEDFELGKEDIRDDVLCYLKTQKKVAAPYVERVSIGSLMDDIFKPFHVVGYKTVIK